MDQLVGQGRYTKVGSSTPEPVEVCLEKTLNPEPLAS